MNLEMYVIEKLVQYQNTGLHNPVPRKLSTLKGKLEKTISWKRKPQVSVCC